MNIIVIYFNKYVDIFYCLNYFLQVNWSCTLALMFVCGRTWFQSWYLTPAWPYTSTSKFRRDQQVLALIGATGEYFLNYLDLFSFYKYSGQHFSNCPQYYKLPIFDACLLWTWNSEEYCCLGRTWAVSDPLQFFNLQSSAASVTAQRSTSLLPTGVGFINVHICHISI